MAQVGYTAAESKRCACNTCVRLGFTMSQKHGKTSYGNETGSEHNAKKDHRLWGDGVPRRLTPCVYY
ncbi:hypothetical protein PG994_006278 [Apiospora phragmitis]|uniref:Uncharacterized protein n=1 Tax=Apiospora phragmitis TaxID=2905665 RepID=A0ABR1VEL5_9PEZI